MKGDAAMAAVVCLGLSNTFRCESWEGEGTIAELTELRGVYPLLSES